MKYGVAVEKLTVLHRGAAANSKKFATILEPRLRALGYSADASSRVHQEILDQISKDASKTRYLDDILKIAPPKAGVPNKLPNYMESVEAAMIADGPRTPEHYALAHAIYQALDETSPHLKDGASSHPKQ